MSWAEAKNPIRSRVIEASAGQAKLGMYLPRLLARCGLARGTGRLGAPGWAGEKRGLFEHPVVIVIAMLYVRLHRRFMYRPRFPAAC
jgi:hypothetical protein